MFATLRLPLPLTWVLEVFIRLLHSSLLGIGLLAALAVAGLFVGTPAVDAATLVTDVAAHFRAEAPIESEALTFQCHQVDGGVLRLADRDWRARQPDSGGLRLGEG